MNYKNKTNLLLIIIAVIAVIVVLIYRGVPIYRTPLCYCESPLLAPLWGVRVIGTLRYIVPLTPVALHWACNPLQTVYNFYLARKNIKENFNTTPTTPVYCFWTGTNQMSDNRKNCLNTIRKNIGCSVILITPDNLAEYITPEYPLHKAYEYLSYTHKADYLRTYMMHVHGGGYTDIKEVNDSWLPYFKLLANNSDKWAIGYKEVGAGGIACNTNCEEVIRNWDKLIGNGCYIFKKQTPLTTDWFNGMNAKLDEKYDALKANPAQAPDDSPGKEIRLSNGQKHISKYPMGWSEMLGGIFHPICYKYHDRLLNTLPPPKFSGYR